MHILYDDTKVFALLFRWTASTDAMRAGSPLRRVAHTVRIGGAFLLTGTGTAAAQDSLLELSGQRGGHKAVLVSGQRQRRRVSAGRCTFPLQKCQGSTSDWLVAALYIYTIDWRTSHSM